MILMFRCNETTVHHGTDIDVIRLHTVHHDTDIDVMRLRIVDHDTDIAVMRRYRTP